MQRLHERIRVAPGIGRSLFLAVCLEMTTLFVNRGVSGPERNKGVTLAAALAVCDVEYDFLTDVQENSTVFELAALFCLAFVNLDTLAACAHKVLSTRQRE